MELIPGNWLPLAKDIVVAVAVIAVSVAVYAVACRGLNRLQSRRALAPPVAAMLKLFLRWTLVILAVFLLLSTFGVLENVWAAFLAILAIVAVGFVAMWSVLSNAFCTLLLLIYKPFQVGDRIAIPADDLEGKVVDLNLMFTTLDAGDGGLLRVPNNHFFQKVIRRIPGDETTDLFEQLKEKDID